MRARIWFFLLKRWRDSIGDISDSKDIRLDDGMGISTNDSWKKEKDISFTEFNIEHLPVLKLDNKKVNNNKTLLYLHGGGYVACGPETHGPLITKLSLYSQANVFFSNL